MLKTIGNTISLGIAAIFFPPISIVTFFSFLGGIALDFAIKETTDENKETIENSVKTIKGCIEDLKVKKKVEAGVQLLKEKFDMTDVDIEYFQNLCLVAHVVNKNNRMNNRTLAV